MFEKQLKEATVLEALVEKGAKRKVIDSSQSLIMAEPQSRNRN